jgi:hypothetical protein
MARRHLGLVSEVSDFLSLFLRAQAGFVIGGDGVEWNAYG